MSGLSRDAATGRGVTFCLAEWVRITHFPLKNASVIIQGFGQVGSWVARLIEGLGCTVVGISDIHARIYNPGGIDVSRAMDHVNREGSLRGFAFDGGEDIGSEEFLTLP